MVGGQHSTPLSGGRCLIDESAPDYFRPIPHPHRGGRRGEGCIVILGQDSFPYPQSEKTSLRRVVFTPAAGVDDLDEAPLDQHVAGD